MEELAGLVEAREPLLPKVWGFVDGLNLRIENPADDLRQNAMYNGWLGYTACSSLLLWCADGLIRFAALNCPGSWHDSGIANLRKGFYAKCETQPDGFHVVGDSAFRKSVTGRMGRAITCSGRPCRRRWSLYASVRSGEWGPSRAPGRERGLASPGTPHSASLSSAHAWHSRTSGVCMWGSTRSGLSLAAWQIRTKWGARTISTGCNIRKAIAHKFVFAFIRDNR